MTVSVERIDFTQLALAKAAEIRRAEQEAEVGYGVTAADETERLRMVELREVANVMLKNKYNAIPAVVFHLGSVEVFSDEEKMVLVNATQRLRGDDYSPAMEVIKWTSLVFKQYQLMERGNGYGFSTTEILNKIQ